MGTKESETTLDVAFTLERETKNTFRYNEDTEDGKPPKIGSLYVQKWALPKPAPSRLTLTLSF